MKKGIAQHILCDHCRTIITWIDHITMQGKKRTLHYCDEKCQAAAGKGSRK